MMHGLTKPMADCFISIRKHQERTGTPPTYDELRIALGYASKASIHRLVKALEERGYITCLFNRARSIALVDHPSAPARAEAA